jgi:hypothetical protein
VLRLFGCGWEEKKLRLRRKYRQRLFETRLRAINHFDVIVLCCVLILLLANLFTFLGILFHFSFELPRQISACLPSVEEKKTTNSIQFRVSRGMNFYQLNFFFTTEERMKIK